MALLTKVSALTVRGVFNRQAFRSTLNTSVRYMVSNADDEDYEESEPATIAGTKTFNNLKDAFARKAMAMARYEFYAQKADVEGLTEAAQALRCLGRSAREQAFGHMEFLDESEDPEEDSSSTEVNVETCINQEQKEYEEFYPQWAETAYSENISDVGTWMESLRDTSFRNMTRLTRVQQHIEDIYKLEEDQEELESVPNGANTEKDPTLSR